MQRGFSNIADISAKLFRFWDGDAAASGDVLESAGRGKPPKFLTPAAGGGGKVVQTVEAISAAAQGPFTAAIPLDDTIPQDTEGTLFGFVSTAGFVTPATNLYRLEALMYASTPTPPTSFAGAWFEVGFASAVGAGGATIGGTDLLTPCVFWQQDLISTLSGAGPGFTFSFRVGTDDGVGPFGINGTGPGFGRFYGGVMKSQLRLLEIIPG